MTGLVDYVAMDIKNSPEKYAETAGIRHPDLESITRTVEYLKSGVVDYEFRTTVVKELHKREDIEAIGQWLSGSRRYFLQNYKESEQVIRPVFTSYSREQLENFSADSSENDSAGGDSGDIGSEFRGSV